MLFHNSIEVSCDLRDVEWTSPETTPAQRKAHVEVLLESLEHKDAEIRFTNARRLFYVLQGSIFVRDETKKTLIHFHHRYFCRDHVSRASAALDL